MSNNPTENTSSSFATDAATGGAMALLSGAMSNAKKSWENSKGQEIFSSVSSSIPEGTKDYINATKSKIFNLSYFRSPKLYFGIGEERPFFLEKTIPILMSRVKQNFTFFYMNYIFLTVVLFLLTLLVSPGAIIGIALLGLAWAGVIKATAEGSTKVYGVTVSQKQASIIMSGVSVVVLCYVLSGVFWWTICTSGFLVGGHAVLRDSSMATLDMQDNVEMSGALDLEGAGGGLGVDVIEDLQ